MGYKKNISELEKSAIYWWPDFLSDLEKNVSVIPKLIETQDKFLSILTLSDTDPFKIFKVIKSSDFPANLLLKHLVVLSDFGGEQIQRLNRQFKSVFPGENGKQVFKFILNGKNYSYDFKHLPISANLNNGKLHIDGKGLSNDISLNGLIQDMVVILLYGSNCTNENTANNLIKCDIGGLLGNKEALEKYVKQKYIWVSRITGGAQANTLGQVAQTYVVDYLRKALSNDYLITRNGSVKVSVDQKNLPFDIVVKKGDKFVGIEVSFQVTTNSTIERKSGQAVARYNLMKKAGYFVAYVIDGAGNFQRKSAITTICKNSDCTVAYKREEFNTLVEFIKASV